MAGGNASQEKTAKVGGESCEAPKMLKGLEKGVVRQVDKQACKALSRSPEA